MEVVLAILIVLLLITGLLTIGGNVLVWLLVGAVAGYLADAVVHSVSFGWVGKVFVGILGAFLGGFIFTLLGVGNFGLPGLLWDLLVSFLGAVLLLIGIGALVDRGYVKR